jgi:hypothetical protein
MNLTDDKLSWDLMRLRLRARRCLCEFTGLPSIAVGGLDSADLLGQLLGYVDYGTMLEHESERDLGLMRGLIGPHGYSIYRVLLARMG